MAELSHRIFRSIFFNLRKWADYNWACRLWI